MAISLADTETKWNFCSETHIHSSPVESEKSTIPNRYKKLKTFHMLTSNNVYSSNRSLFITIISDMLVKTSTVQCRTKLWGRTWQRKISRCGIYGDFSERSYFDDTDKMNIQMIPFLDHNSMWKAVMRPQNLCKLGSLLLAGVHTSVMHAVKTVFSIQTCEFILTLRYEKQEMARL